MKNLTLFLFLILMNISSALAVSTITDASGHYDPAWRGSAVRATLGTYLSGSYQFGEPIYDISGKMVESTYFNHFHMNYAKPRFNCVKNNTYRAEISTAGVGIILGEKEGYAIIQSNIPGIGYRIQVGAIFSGSYNNSNISRYSKFGINGINNIEIPCNATGQFTLDVKITLVKTNEVIIDDAGSAFKPINVPSPFPNMIQVYDDSNNLVLIGTWVRALKKPSNISVKYIKESCRYNLSNVEQILNLGEVKSKQFTGVGSTVAGDSGQKKVDVWINCSGTNSIKNIRASIFENNSANQATTGMRKEGVLLNNLTGPNASKGVGVQVLINDKVKPLGVNSPVYIDDDTQWDIENSPYNPLTGVYKFSVSGRYYQVEPKIEAGKLQTTMGFILIYR